MRFGVLAIVLSVSSAALAAPTFRAQEIAKDLAVVYAVNVADMNRDRKPDIVAINNTQVMWFENPGWQKHVVFDGTKDTSGFWKKDNVTFATEDIDGDGWLDVALGADWQPTNTTSGGSVQWLRRDRKDPKAPWQLFPISTEPTVHRMRWADVDGDGRRELLVKALQGRGTKPPSWEGDGARVLVFRKPADPVNDPWLVQIADDTLHIAHNFLVLDAGRGPATLITASKEGLNALARDKAGVWSRKKLGEGVPGEVKLGTAGKTRHFATIEPWHGTSVVVYRDPGGPLGERIWPREVIDTTLTEGHAIGWGDFDGDGDDELVAGWRKKPFGVALYDRDPAGKWTKVMIDEGGMAAEDVIIADLDGDKRPEIIAGGRATSNIKIYWTPKK